MKPFSFIILSLILAAFSTAIHAQCDSLFLGNDTTLCDGLTLQLDAGPGYTSYIWNDGSTGQLLTVNEPGEYWCEVEFLDSANLVQNGDFESGNVSFYTDYIWGIGGPWGILSEEGTYVIDANAALTHVNFSPCVDHSTGDGLFMIINGDTVQGENVWCQTVIVEPNTDYFFSGWFTSVHPANPAVLSYYINGTIIETVYLSGSTCIWQNFIKEWNSGGNAEAEICIINQNTELGGNDFGIDDIHLLTVCRVSDTISVSYEPAPAIDLGNDTLLCEGQTLELNAGSGYSGYLWSNGSGDSTLMVNLPGIYWVKVTSSLGCIGGDTLIVEYTDGLEIDLGSDTALCQGGGLLLDPGEGYASYLWQDGSTGQTYEVTDPGSYWVTVEDENGCVGQDTIQVMLSPAVQLNLGGDTTVCAGNSYTLNPGAGFSSYLWQDGSTGSTYPVNAAGIYWVLVYDSYGCSGSDTVTVGLNPSPEVSLGNDTVICTGSILVLDPGSQYSSYLWQDNSNLPVYSVSNSGFYSVTVTNTFSCTAHDEIFVEVTSPDISLGQDTNLCSGDTLVLEPGTGYASYLWQDNSSSPEYIVTVGGSYSVTVTDDNNCSSHESIEITELPVPLADLGGDQVLCSGGSLYLETVAGPYAYLWNGEPGNNSMEVFTGGTYTVEVSNQCGSDTDMITVTEEPVPEVELGPDRVLQPGESIQLDAGAGFDQYVWQDGSTGRYYEVNSNTVDAGSTVLWVDVWIGPCKSSDSTRMEVFRVKVPNVITPNGDGVNDTFTPMADSWSGIERHHIEIFNRWGEKVWETDDFEAGWDGKRNDKHVAEGTYFWVAELFFGIDTNPMTIKGTVTVIRSRN